MGICTAVIGMPRSGTSATTRLLNIAGLHLGDDVIVDPDINATGIFQDKTLSRICGQTAAFLGGGPLGPNCPAPTYADDVTNSALTLGWDMAAQARAQIASDYAGTDWLFKDPMLLFYREFWEPIIQPVRWVVCLRNPLSVSHSIQDKFGLTLAQGLALWQQFYETLVRSDVLASCTFTQFEAMKADYLGETNRLLGLLGLPALTEQQADQASAYFNADLSNYGFAASDLTTENGVSQELADLYNDLAANGTNATPHYAGGLADLHAAILPLWSD